MKCQELNDRVRFCIEASSHGATSTAIAIAIDASHSQR